MAAASSSWSWAQIIGAGVCTLAALAVTRKYLRPRKPLPNNGRFCVVVTGSTHGLGLALAQSLLRLSKNNIRVVVNGRQDSDVKSTVDNLRNEFQSLFAQDPECISGFAADICNIKQAEDLAQFAKAQMGCITHWINNAGITQSTRSTLEETDLQELRDVLNVNLFGTINATSAALKVMHPQGFGHVFLMEGSGSRQNATPRSIGYGASKAAFPQLCKSLRQEANGRVGIHTISPGMVLTRLLLKSATEPRARLVFDLLAELPATVADSLAPRILRVEGSGSHLAFLTMFRVVAHCLLFWKFKNRFFDRNGNCTARIN